MGRRESLILWECKFRCIYSQAGHGLCTWPWTLILPCFSLFKMNSSGNDMNINHKQTEKWEVERWDHWASQHTEKLDKSGIAKSVWSSWSFSSLQNIIRAKSLNQGAKLSFGACPVVRAGAAQLGAAAAGVSQGEQRGRIPSPPCCPGHVWCSGLWVHWAMFSSIINTPPSSSSSSGLLSIHLSGQTSFNTKTFCFLHFPSFSITNSVWRVVLWLTSI